MDNEGNRFAAAGAQIPARLRAVGPGWHLLLERLHAQLTVDVPGYRATDVTEKRGGLRIHVTTGEQAVTEKVRALVAASVTEAAATCEFCGAVGRPRSHGLVRPQSPDRARCRAAPLAVAGGAFCGRYPTGPSRRTAPSGSGPSSSNLGGGGGRTAAFLLVTRPHRCRRVISPKNGSTPPGA